MTSTHELKSLSDDELLRRLAELVQRSRRVDGHPRRPHRRSATSGGSTSARHRRCSRTAREGAAPLGARGVRAHHRRAGVAAPSVAAGDAERRPVASERYREARAALTDANAADLLARAAHRTKSQDRGTDCRGPRRSRTCRRRSARCRCPTGPPRKLNSVRPSWRARRCAAFSHLAPTLTRLRPQSRPGHPPPPPQAPAVTALRAGALQSPVHRAGRAPRQARAPADPPGPRSRDRHRGRGRRELERPRSKALRADQDSTPNRGRDRHLPRSRHLPAAVRAQRHARATATNARLSYATALAAPSAEAWSFTIAIPTAAAAITIRKTCLMCRQHNAFLAELDYGKEHMEQYRRRGDRGFEARAHGDVRARAHRARPTPPHSYGCTGTAANASNQMKSANFAVNRRTANRY